MGLTKQRRKVGRPKSRNPKEWRFVRLRGGPHNVLKILTEPGESISDTVEKILLTVGFMTEEGKPTKLIYDSVKEARGKAAALKLMEEEYKA